MGSYFFSTSFKPKAQINKTGTELVAVAGKQYTIISCVPTC